MPVKNEASYIRLNDQDFEFMIAVSNRVDRLSPINQPAIKRLVIEEDIRQWWTKGFLIFDNKFNAFERPKTDDNEEFSYRFRNDGNDLLIFRLRPVIQNQPDDLLNDDVWNMEFVFSIYDTQDISDGVNPDNKFKKLFFWEYDHQLMLVKTIDWSTSEIEPVVSINSAQAVDADRAVPTGDAIKSLLTKALPEKPQTFSSIWDTGASSMQYNMAANETVEECLQYLLKKHVSTVHNDPCILSRHRYTKEWELESLADIFTKAIEQNKPGEYQIEHFFIDSMTEMEQQVAVDKLSLIRNPAPYKTPVFPKDQISLTRNLQLRDYSLIKSFEFVDMAAMDNLFTITDIPVYSNDTSSKQFNLDYEQNNVVNIQEYFRKTYVDKLKHPGCAPDPLFTLNNIKNEGYTIHVAYSLGATDIDRLADGRSEIIKAAILLNQCIVFRVKGMSFRTAGRFIGIDREIGATQNEFDNKLCGQWLVTNVKHIMVDDAYVNEITAVKIHSSGPLNINTVEQYEPTV
jgi:hypothetical protein